MEGLKKLTTGGSTVSAVRELPCGSPAFGPAGDSQMMTGDKEEMCGGEEGKMKMLSCLDETAFREDKPQRIMYAQWLPAPDSGKLVLHKQKLDWRNQDYSWMYEASKSGG